MQFFRPRGARNTRVNLHTTKTPKTLSPCFRAWSRRDAGKRCEPLCLSVRHTQVDTLQLLQALTEARSSSVVRAERENGGRVGGKCTFLFLIVSFLCPQDQVSSGPDTDQTLDRGRLLAHMVGSAFFCICVTTQQQLPHISAGPWGESLLAPLCLGRLTG